ncbi:hypothetical protein ACJW31_12G029800 [Castanea mollissima]
MERISLSLLCLSFLPLTLCSSQTRVDINIYISLPCIFYNKVGLIFMIYMGGGDGGFGGKIRSESGGERVRLCMEW